MDLVSGYKGVVGRIFKNENFASDDDSYVERLLDRISNGTLAEDRRTATLELQSVVAESRNAQLAFGAIGLPVILGVLKEERDDIEMVRGALETLLGALTPIDHVNMPKNEVKPASLNADLLSQEAEEDFYVRYYTLQLLTALLSNSLNRIQEAILTIPRGITQLMDMLMDREVIRNEALLLLTYLTREAEEIQKIVVFEGAFEKIFNIIQEEGSSEGGMVVQDCLELLNNILRNNVSNQILMKETIGFDPLLSILKLRGSSYKFTQQKTINLLNAIETINLLMGTSDPDTSQNANVVTAKTVLIQKKALDHLLVLAVESRWAPVAVRCAALQCIGDLIIGHPKNRDTLASKKLGVEPQIEPAINSILRIILRTSSVQEFIAADYVIMCFCEENVDGQAMLASTLIPQPHSMTHAPIEEDTNMSFGSMLLHGLTMSECDGDLETCSRAAAVLSHVLKDNLQCKDRFLQINVEAPMGSLETSEPLMHRMVKYLALSSSVKNIDGNFNTSVNLCNQPIILRLLIIWLASCPSAVSCFLYSRPHLTYLLDLVSNQAATVCIGGLAAILLGECVLHNNSNDTGKDAFAIVDAISQKVGLTAFLLKLDEMQKSFLFTSAKPFQPHKPLMRSPSASTEEIEVVDEKHSSNRDKENHLILSAIFDSHFVDFVDSLGPKIKDRILEVYSQAKNEVTVVPAELEQKPSESDGTYIIRLKSFLEKQCLEIQNLLNRNAILAEELARVGGVDISQTEQLLAIGGAEQVQMETLRGKLLEATQRVEMLKAEKAKIESDSHSCKNVVGKLDSELRCLSDAYNSLEQANFHLEKELKALRTRGSVTPDIEALKAAAREVAQNDNEVELNDLLVCLGQEQSKVSVPDCWSWE